MKLAIALVTILALGVVIGPWIVKPGRMGAAIALGMFVTRPTVTIAGLQLRYEIVVGAICLGLLLLRPTGGDSRRLGAASWLASCMLCVAWLSCAIVSSVTTSPQPALSLHVIVWCAASLTIAVWVARHPDAWRPILRSGLVLTLLSGVAAIAFWALASAGIAQVCVQPDPAYGGFAAYDMSIEANLLGGLICLWSLVAVVNPMHVAGPRLRLALNVLAPFAILATHTRAALVAYVIGLLLSTLWLSRARRAIVALIPVGALMLAGGVLLSHDSGLQKFSHIGDLSSGTGGLRFETNRVALIEWWSHSPLFGLGFNSYGQRHSDMTQPQLHLPGYLGNLPLQIAYDGGILALGLTLAACSLVLRQLARTNRLRYAVVLGLPYLIFSIATSSLWMSETWVFVGLAWAATQSPSAMTHIRLGPDSRRLSVA